jgi:hypothetical protein
LELLAARALSRAGPLLAKRSDTAAAWRTYRTAAANTAATGASASIGILCDQQAEASSGYRTQKGSARKYATHGPRVA